MFHVVFRRGLYMRFLALALWYVMTAGFVDTLRVVRSRTCVCFVLQVTAYLLA